VWCPDGDRWVATREAAVRRIAALGPNPRLPLRIRLDQNLVEAVRARRAIRPVSRCGDALCGVASQEFTADWDLLTATSLFTPADADTVRGQAYGAFIIGTFRGEDIDSIAAAMVRANILRDPQSIPKLDDETFEIAALGSLFRFLDAAHSRSYADLSGELDHLQPEVFTKWLAHLGGIRPSPRRTSTQPPLLGATFSVINRIEQSPVSDRSHLEIEHLQHAGYDALALIPFAGQKGPFADEVQMWNRSPESETDLDLQIVASRAHRLNMQVLLKPQVWVGHGTDSLHINPRGGWDRWFASYRRFILHHALVARLEHIEWLAIGTELTLTEKQPQWHALIRDIRAIYPGQLVYAANWDAFTNTPFWNELDAIGIDVYAPLVRKETATDAELLEGARANVAEIASVAARAGKPVLLTEIGFPSTKSPWREPWSERRDDPIQLEDQARCYRAFLSALRGAQWFSGLFVWKYESDPDFRDSTGFFPDFKPAQKVIESFLADAAKRKHHLPASQSR